MISNEVTLAGLEASRGSVGSAARQLNGFETKKMGSACSRITRLPRLRSVKSARLFPNLGISAVNFKKVEISGPAAVLSRLKTKHFVSKHNHGPVGFRYRCGCCSAIRMFQDVSVAMQQNTATDVRD